MKTKKQRMIETLKEHWVILLSGVLGYLMLFTTEYFALLGFLLLFNVFDLFGFDGIFNPLKKVDMELYRKLLVYYRIIQTMFMISALTIIVLLHGWSLFALTIIVHFCGAQDVLFYIFGKYPFPKKWRWLEWSVVGWFYGGIPIPNWVIITQAIVGVAASVIIILLK